MQSPGNRADASPVKEIIARISESVKPAGYSSLTKEGYTYGHAGQITSTTDANGGVITYRYNSQGKVCETIDQEGLSETFRYDREGRMVLHTDRNGNQVRTSYNVDGNPVLEAACNADGKGTVTRSWEYDPSGNVKKAVAGGFCYTYEYRPDGKLLKKSSSGKTLLACAYYPDGSLQALTDLSGETVYYAYDQKGNLSAIRDASGKELASYFHTPGGKLKEIRHGNGMQTSYEYDTDGNITHLLIQKPDGSSIFDYHYQYDLNGNRTLKAGSQTMPGEGHTDGSYARQSIIYRYDRMNRLEEEECDGKATSYSYDLCGNRLKKRSSGEEQEYSYNRKNQLVECRGLDGRTTYHYDRQGNVLQASGEKKSTWYTYDAFNQQTKVRTSDGQVLENQYDAEYLRAGTIENGKTSRFLYFGGELLAETDRDEDVISRYILGYGVAAGWERKSGGYHYWHLDEHNSTAYITDPQQNICNSYQYDAFGNIQNKEEGIHNRILYTGQQYDQISGQHYLRARYYNPIVGRFLQEDVYRGDGLNLCLLCE